MALVADLNDLLKDIRGALEAAQAVAKETKELDPDIERGLEDVIEGERWSSSGLYHRITQSGGTPTLLESAFPTTVATKETLQAQIKALCNYEGAIARRVRRLLSHKDVDEVTGSLLSEMEGVHTKNAHWCSQILLQWEPDPT